MVAKIHSMGLFGFEVFPVEVETDLSSGLPAFDVVGLPDTAVKESRDRVRAAIRNCGFDFPIGRITINLAPADKRKEGPMYDLPLLLSLLQASGQLDCCTADAIFLGELSLSGEVRHTRGVLPMAVKAKAAGFSRLFVPEVNALEGAAIEGLEVYPVRSVPQLIAHLRGRETIDAITPKKFEYIPDPTLDFADVKGQAAVKRAMEIAASGGHSILLLGPPGSGKSMLARRLPSILPPMTFREAIGATMIHSLAEELPDGSSLLNARPFRSPHHTISATGLSGGGSTPRPGEISLAHNGVLFLDELPEFSVQAMQILRQPMEEGRITISRASGHASFPCRFMFVAAMNPCPCGYFGHPTKPCTCSPKAVNRYLARISGPLRDRIDLHVEVSPVDFEQLSTTKKGESSAQIRERVNTARKIQLDRFKDQKYTCNAKMPPSQLEEMCRVTSDARNYMKQAFEFFGFSARSYSSVLKMARTIADLERSDYVTPDHIAEAVQYRSMDRKFWQKLG